MTTAHATSVVSIERHENVVYLSFRSAVPPPAAEREEPWWPWTEPAEAVSGKPATATRPIPVRWSPRPARALARRFTQLMFGGLL